MLRFVALLAVLSVLSGCVSSTKIRAKVTETVSKPELKIAKPGAVRLERVKWIVVTEANAAEVFASLGDKATIIAVTPDGFSKLQRNNAQLLALVKKYRSVVLAYENYYKP